MASKGSKELALRLCSGSSSDFQFDESRALTPGFECETSSLSFTQQRKTARPAKKGRSPPAADPGPIPHLDVRAIWMHVGHGEKDFLLLEDVATGDILIPLSQVKRVISGNFSRKLASYTARLVVEPEGGLGPRTPDLAWYWRKAFESPKNVKIEVKRALGEDASTAGHISIVLLPIVYNAIVAKEKEYNDDNKERQANCKDFPWTTRFFVEVERLLLESSYGGLIKKREPCAPAAVPAKTSMHTRSNSRSTFRVEAPAETGEVWQPLFRGPSSLKATQTKFMFTHPNERARQNNRGVGVRSKRGTMEEPALPVIPAVSGVVDDKLARFEEQLQEHKRQRLAQDAKIEQLEKKLDRYDGLMAMFQHRGSGSHLEHAAEQTFGRQRQLCLQQRSKSTDTISSSGPPVKGNTEQMCWDHGYPHISIDRHSAPPEFQPGMGTVEMSPSPSFHTSTPMHGQRSMQMEHSASDLASMANQHPFKPSQLSCVDVPHFLTPLEDSPEAPFQPLDHYVSGRAPRAPHRRSAALPLHHINPPLQYGQSGLPVVGHMGSNTFSSIFNLGPDDMNRRI